MNKEARYYVYQHIRDDKNEVFYVGIGTKRLYNYSWNCYSEKYHRAYSKQKRKKIWNDIVRKTTYRVEIILESHDYNFVKEQEIERIAFYGRKDLGTGTLANLTNGGEGTVGYIQDRYKTAKKVYVYDIQGNYVITYLSTQDASKSLGVDRGGISAVATGKYPSIKGYRFSYIFAGLKIAKLVVEHKSNKNENNKRSKTTIKWKYGKVVEMLPSLREFQRKYNYKSSVLCNAIKNKTQAYGYTWTYQL